MKSNGDGLRVVRMSDTQAMEGEGGSPQSSLESAWPVEEQCVPERDIRLTLERGNASPMGGPKLGNRGQFEVGIGVTP